MLGIGILRLSVSRLNRKEIKSFTLILFCRCCFPVLFLKNYHLHISRGRAPEQLHSSVARFFTPYPELSRLRAIISLFTILSRKGPLARARVTV